MCRQDAILSTAVEINTLIPDIYLCLMEYKGDQLWKNNGKIVALAKSRGFVYPGSEIYGGLANTWDYGNLGVELKNNVKRAWWKSSSRKILTM